MSEDQKEGEDRGFKVKDRRRFESSGDPRQHDDQDDRAEIGAENPETDTNDEAAGGAETGAAESDHAAGETEASSAGSASAAVGFSGFVVGLAQQAFMLLGAAPDPISGVVQKELDQAAAMIDIIAMLQEKTAGNLTDDEARLVEEVLYELRMRYVGATSPATTDPGDNS